MQRAFLLSKLALKARTFHCSAYAAKLVVEKVPALGESITEGSIASWTKKEGDKIAVDDVIVIVETDKVTVDIKSTHAGVLTKRLAEDNVVVGMPLYEMDTDGSAAATSTATAEKEKTAPAPASTANAPAADTHDKDDGHRKPLIKFLGKRDKTKKEHSPAAAPATAPVAAQPAQPKVAVREGNGVHFTTLKGMALFGRPVLSLKEIEAIESGGATAL